jgi:cyanate permease
LFGIPGVAVGLLWWFTGREPAKNETETPANSQVPLKQAFSRVIRCKEVWVLGLISLTLWGSNNGLVGYLPLYLRNIGWAPASADTAITVMNGASMLGSIPMVLLAARFKAYKQIFFISMIVQVATFAMLPIIPGLGVWPLLIVSAFLRAGVSAIVNVLLLENKEIGVQYIGTAMGLVGSLGMLGALFSPPLGNYMAIFSPGAPFFFWSGLATLALPLFLFLRKRRERAIEVKTEAIG